MQQGAQTLTSADRAWATHQVAVIIGSTEQDAAPLADFLVGIESAAELQTQLLDMLGESPMALDFAFALIAKRFPPVPEPQQTARSSQPLGVAWTSSAVAYRKGGSAEATAAVPSLGHTAKSQNDAHINSQDMPPLPPAQKSQRQQKKEKQQQERQQKEIEEKSRRTAKRKRVKCECQASEHTLLTNCLTCGRIICDKEGPGPCMFCGAHVESPDQQLQQHMQRLLNRAEEAKRQHGTLASSGSARKTQSSGGTSYSMKAGGGFGTRDAELLWPANEANPSTESGPAPTLGAVAELSEEEYLQLAFKALAIDNSTADPASVREAEAWVKAMRRKEKLLDFDRTAAQRTKLIDQASDFDPHAIGKWMTPIEKAEAARRAAAKLKEDEEREHRRRQGTRVLRLNFAKGTIDMSRADEEPGSDVKVSAIDNPPANPPPHKAAVAASPPKPSASSAGSFAHNPLLGGAAEPRFVLSVDKLSSAKTTASSSSSESPSARKLAQRRLMLRLQDDTNPALLS
ncbi:hypothetical protein GGH13_003462 [Coemansia sp. S155-1]|nr:hypothetical protein GGI14_002231 [Coemansia sp. S680]KAJ2027499.1 hypothetical protein H4S03_008228 [Coemansia sp. S3946]KAJ2071273.1 hypothetical protein GGH13_003462 [Coemansia sp. S155-1]